MTLVKWTPNRSLTNYNNIESFLNNFWDNENTYLNKFTPSVDIEETSNNYNFLVELPGLTQKDVKLSVKDNILSITGEKKYTKEKTDDHFRRLESSYGSFERSFKLPDNIDQEKIDADFKNGILNIAVPKTEKAKPREIKVKFN